MPRTIVNAPEVINALGGEIEPGKCRCPICDGKLSVGEENGKVLLKCWGRGCDNNTKIIPWLRERGAWGQRSTPQRTNGQDDKEEKKAERVRRAKDILKAARKADLSPEAYLKGRGVKIVPDNAFLLPAPAARRLKLALRNFPRVVVPVVNNAGEETGCHTIVLNRDGTKKLRLKDKTKPVKFSYGLLSGNHVRLGEPDPDSPLAIAEGFETACSVAEITGLPTIATLGTAFHAKANPPDCAEAIICADAGAPGIEAAEALAQRLTVPTRIAIPIGPDGYDWNDAVREGTPIKELKRMILSAGLFVRNERPLTMRAIADFETLPLEWFWHPFVPLAMVTVMFGDGGVGKSTVIIDLISRLTSRNKRMPQDEAISGSAVILTKEDDVERLVRPRLEAARADLERVRTPGYDVPDDPKDFEPVDALDGDIIDELERLIAELGDVRLIVIDPANDFCGKIDPQDDKQVRAFLTPLTRLARRYDLAVVVVSHINKNQMQAAVHRGLGSVAWRNVPRSAVLVADDPDRGGRKLVVQTKTNLTEFGRTALGFTMRTRKVGEARYGVVDWEDDFCEADPEALLAKPKPKTKLEQAKEFLEDLLKNGSMPREEIRYMAEGEGISWRTMIRAKKQLRLISIKRKGEKQYRWRLPKRRGT